MTVLGERDNLGDSLWAGKAGFVETHGERCCHRVDVSMVTPSGPERQNLGNIPHPYTHTEIKCGNLEEVGIYC